MDIKSVKRIIDDTAYVRTGGSPEEKRCAEYLLARCEEVGMTARLEGFDVQMADISSESLEIDGVSIPNSVIKVATFRGWIIYGSPDLRTCVAWAL